VAHPSEQYHKKAFWIRENLLYAEGNFRLRKCARLINELAAGRACDLLDVGCGPAALRGLLDRNIVYRGIDIAIQKPAPDLMEVDFVEQPIAYGEQRFDFVVALGVFEYVGSHQREKLIEIGRILKPGGAFIVSYINFSHVRRKILPIYNNVRPIAAMTESLTEWFNVDACFPVSHHWRQKQPGRNALPRLQMTTRWNIPVFSRRFAVEYFWICSQRQSRGAAG
jgi:SAM-dependent methyltransferase